MGKKKVSVRERIWSAAIATIGFLCVLLVVGLIIGHNLFVEHTLTVVIATVVLFVIDLIFPRRKLY
ncbi:hypothetical protein [Porphyromonas cangingivalis]|uniref:Uncharacterized protein n=1 Tax=Porphyromonas cangingivalis TaxID=36874 RepID=A0A0A2ERI0_PORCN|nr:hypothetical protein [Porphyromonas cangingivalis]KGN80287.1 hypothetical protein HQ35_06270 [Porphyromonas cangingivalis]SJZ32801.1 hypothetical protein SAMN02745205_00322 [Porphyromonas cangingivalis]VEJ04668.1 Uncharacterised protein [Porphyromonas cangingivalis]